MPLLNNLRHPVNCLRERERDILESDPTKPFLAALQHNSWHLNKIKLTRTKRKQEKEEANKQKKSPYIKGKSLPSIHLDKIIHMYFLSYYIFIRSCDLFK